MIADIKETKEEKVIHACRHSYVHVDYQKMKKKNMIK